ncbi:hypothetical protein CEE69_07960 [Rhodopirellula bahusiensis]|uniref:Uncharacterized protein n=1 Tax=Rhodopirellula bahusiensis TaxID=2014065 RepID=A0A2G1WA99_9BACT|nr:hypothetical protein CEE69_07960 [Rhodopirellula bahusiensis]
MAVAVIPGWIWGVADESSKIVGGCRLAKPGIARTFFSNHVAKSNGNIAKVAPIGNPKTNQAQSLLVIAYGSPLTLDF